MQQVQQTAGNDHVVHSCFLTSSIACFACSWLALASRSNQQVPTVAPNYSTEARQCHSLTCYKNTSCSTPLGPMLGQLQQRLSLLAMAVLTFRPALSYDKVILGCVPHPRNHNTTEMLVTATANLSASSAGSDEGGLSLESSGLPTGAPPHHTCMCTAQELTKPASCDVLWCWQSHSPPPLPTHLPHIHPRLLHQVPKKATLYTSHALPRAGHGQAKA
jgi:hypothetical protein